MLNKDAETSLGVFLHMPFDTLAQKVPGNHTLCQKEKEKQKMLSEHCFLKAPCRNIESLFFPGALNSSS